ncbi:MAG: hypothetical protein HN742_20500 [Lentisphaerae bacterium]|jgi:hypothetical protein|nr:hypothetical protein [Lentisphaerota bacterium]MBT4817106.1 hypothetical protein [Lentisphaerota bacterium]MBT5611512.1 hypothetical protein [Lentisphaerota bacterium]MBT7054748.1 hypothetical protein [Lentisphaerota bacterium]MBT7844272.1 hypothetical protein [Lentisphaerota bacterium]
MKTLLTQTLTIGLVVLLGGQSMSAGNSSSNEAIDIGSRLELFVDRHLIDSLDGAELRMHRPQRLPLAASPLGAGAYSTVIKDGDLYRAYYRSDDSSYKGKRGYSGHPGEITCYAESRDGHEWAFPSLGLHEINGSRDNNVILAGLAPFSHNFSPFLDTRPGVAAEERYKALAGHPGYDRDAHGEGLHAFTSADGIRWRKTSDEPVIPYDRSWPHAFDSQNVSFWSEAEQLYVCYFRTWLTQHGKLRTISRTTSPDFVHWSKPNAMEPNRPGEHLYTSQTHPYFRAPHIYIALPTRFQPKRGNSTDILFMTTRAGSTSYERLFTEAFIRPGLDPGRWGNRSNYVALNVVPTGPAEMSIYHAKSRHRYVLRTDGFVSVGAGSAQGELVTKPLIFRGNELVLNVSTSAAGSLRVEVRGPDGQPVPGLGLDDCAPVVGDEIERIVGWKGNGSLGALAGTPVRLRFTMVECDLYSFRFR